MSDLDAVILDLVESKKLSIAALRFIFLRKNQFKRTSLNRPLLFSCPLEYRLNYLIARVLQILMLRQLAARLFISGEIGLSDDRNLDIHQEA